MFKRPDDPPEHNYLYFLPTAALLALYAAGRYYAVPQIGTMAYLVSSAACIAAIGCLSNQSSARAGNALGMMGVAGGLVATTGMLDLSRELAVQLGGSLAAGLGLGWLLARRMQITVLPQMVAAFHSLVRPSPLGSCAYKAFAHNRSTAVCVWPKHGEGNTSMPS